MSEVPSKSALKVPAFRRLTLAWGFSNFGDSTLYLTLAVWVKDITGSDASAGLVFLFLGLPVLLSPVAGQIADRGSRRRLVILANLTGAAVVMTLGFVDGKSDVWIIYVVTFLYGMITYLTSAAGSGLIRDMLADEQLASGNGLLSTIDQGLRLVSPLVGVGAYAAFGGFAIAWVTALMLVIAASVMTTVRLVESTPPPREPFWPEISAGVRHIRSVPVLARVTVAMGIAFGITGLANTVVFAMIDKGLHRGSEFFGVIAALQGFGSIIGGITAALIIGKLGERGVIAFGLVLMAVAIGAASVPNVVMVCAGTGAVGLAVPWFMVAFSTMRQKATPSHLQGRVQAATTLAFNGPQTIGTAAGAALVTVVHYQVLLVVMAVVIAACAIPVAVDRRATDTVPSV
jgi:MFS family permease